MDTAALKMLDKIKGPAFLDRGLPAEEFAGKSVDESAFPVATPALPKINLVVVIIIIIMRPPRHTDTAGMKAQAVRVNTSRNGPSNN